MPGRAQWDQPFRAASGPLAAASMFLFSSVAFATMSVQASGPPVPATDSALQVMAPSLEVDPLSLTSEMMRFADERIAPRQSGRARLVKLQDAIFDTEEGLGVTYGSAETHTAAGTFEARTGNCLSFTLLFVALARHIGLETHFIEVDEVTGWSQRGDIGLNHWHMYAEVEIEGAKVPVDFLPWSERRYRSSRRISEERVRAHFHNNLGAELVALDRFEGALAHMERALDLDPSFHPARINLAVGYRRIGRLDEAEELLLEVLGAEPRNSVAAANLATLYVEQGRKREAAKWLAKRATFLARNPFHHFRLGVLDYAAGRYLEARDSFKRAIARQRDEPLFYERLAETHLRLGEKRKARSNLRRALYFTESPERRRTLEDRLASLDLRAGAGS